MFSDHDMNYTDSRLYRPWDWRLVKDSKLQNQVLFIGRVEIQLLVLIKFIIPSRKAERSDVLRQI